MGARGRIAVRLRRVGRDQPEHHPQPRSNRDNPELLGAQSHPFGLTRGAYAPLPANPQRASARVWSA